MNATVSIILSFPDDIDFHCPILKGYIIPAAKPYIPYYGRKENRYKVTGNLGITDGPQVKCRRRVKIR
jgi:hypothetical protein